MESLVSVIIPTYKRSTCLLRAINSVINQTYKNIEIIVVDDNDEKSEYRKNNEKRLNKYIESDRIIYLKHKKNLNGAAARNTGIKQAHGSYITFLDDDDYFFPTRIEKLVNILNKNKSYGGAYSSVVFEDKTGDITNLLHAHYEGNLQKLILSDKSFFGTGSNMFFRKEIVDKIGFFDTKFKRHQDFEYIVRFFQYAKIINLDEFLVVKSNYDSINKPNYQMLLESKQLFLNKFEKIINKYDYKTKRDIFVSNLYVLYNYASSVDKKEIMEKMKLYGENKLNIYINNYKIVIKRFLKQFRIIKKVNMFLIDGKKYKLLLNELKKTIEVDYI